MDEKAWKSLQGELRKEFETLLELAAANTNWSDRDQFAGALAQVGHSAYHLGAMRQIRKEILAP